MSSRLEAMLADIDAQADASLKKLDQTAEFAQRTESLTVDGESLQREVVVTVNGTGHAINVRFEAGFDRLSAAELSAAVMAAHGQAQRRLSFRVEQLGDEIYGPGSAMAASYAQAYRQQYGYEEED